MIVITQNAKETRRIAGEMAKKLLRKRLGKALVVALAGELGTGKTTFVSGFSKALGVNEKILSPTFVLIHKHKISYKSNWTNKSYRTLFHIDAYRLNSGKNLMKLGAKEIFADPESIVLIEWADRVKKAIPKTAIWIHFKHSGKNKRKIFARQPRTGETQKQKPRKFFKN